MSDVHTVKCHYCAKAIDPDGMMTYQRVTGWIRRRSAGGPNRAGLTTEQEWACDTCIWRIKRGLDPLQAELAPREWSVGDLELLDQLGLDPADVEP